MIATNIKMVGDELTKTLIISFKSIFNPTIYINNITLLHIKIILKQN